MYVVQTRGSHYERFSYFNTVEWLYRFYEYDNNNNKCTRKEVVRK